MSEQIEKLNYRIGAVSRLTGVPTDTLRAWERRYNLVTPLRSEGGDRLYTQEDVSRLSLIKQLVDNGYAIGTLTELSAEQLHDRLTEIHGKELKVSNSGPVRTAVVGKTLPQRALSQVHLRINDTIELVDSYTSPDDFLTQLNIPSLDALIVEYPVIDEDRITEINQLLSHAQASKTFVVYGFGNAFHLSQLEHLRVRSIRFPVTWDEISFIIASEFNLDQDKPSNPKDINAFEATETTPERLFEDRQLALAATLSTAIKCECPRNLADLVLSLCHFEDYSATCENHNAEDAALHSYLRLTSAKARRLMEEALQKAIDVEGIKLD